MEGYVCVKEILEQSWQQTYLNMEKYRSKANKLQSFLKSKCWIWTLLLNRNREFCCKSNCFNEDRVWRRNSLEQLKKLEKLRVGFGKRALRF